MSKPPPFIPVGFRRIKQGEYARGTDFYYNGCNGWTQLGHGHRGHKWSSIALHPIRRIVKPKKKTIKLYATLDWDLP